jgi:hypothetical protein
MTIVNGFDGPARATDGMFRVIAASFAVLLAAQCIWLLISELTRTPIYQLPVDQVSAATAANYRAAAGRAALFGVIRGDLWAESAFTQATLFWSDKDADADSSTTQAVADAHSNVDRALTDGPHQSGAWLFLADLALRFQSVGLAPSDLLKMSYYTGASDQRLMPLRLRISAQLTKFDDVEIRQLVSRDLLLFLTRNQTAEIADAYGVASPAAKSFIEQTVQDIDPTALQKIRAAVPRKQNIPE